MNNKELEALLRQVIAALEASVPNNPRFGPAKKHQKALWAATHALENLVNQSK